MAVLAVKAARRESREEEIRLHGKPIRHHHVVASKKVYNRKKTRQTANEVCLVFYGHRAHRAL